MMMMSVVIVRNVMEDNINNHFGRYSLRNDAVNNSKEEHQRLKKLDESWKSILDEIVIEYVTNISYHGKPSYSETTLFGDSCDCATTRTKEVLCVYLAGKSIVFIGYYIKKYFISFLLSAIRQCI